MAEINDGGPAFPIPDIYACDGTGLRQGADGMTLRDHFATHAPPPPPNWATVHTLPIFSGDGYDYGGATVLCIGGFAIPFGDKAGDLAERVAEAWNTRGAAAEIKVLQEALRAVEKWWLEDGMHRVGGAPACIFQVRSLLAARQAAQAVKP